MKRWETTQQMGKHIASIDVLTDKQKERFDELNIAHCNKIASVTKKLYKLGGKSEVIKNLGSHLPAITKTTVYGFTANQKMRSKTIVKQMFKWHWLPWSSIRKNMKYLAS